MKEILKEAWLTNIWLRILSISSLLLIIAGFICPPLAIISGSVLTAVGELEALGVLWIVLRAVEKGTGASFKKGDVEVDIKEKEDKAGE